MLVVLCVHRTGREPSAESFAAGQDSGEGGRARDMPDYFGALDCQSSLSLTSPIAFGLTNVRTM